MPNLQTLKLRLLIAVALTVGLAGCVYDAEDGLMRASEYEQLSTARTMPLHHAWIAAPGAEMVFQRPIYAGQEQRIHLRNATSLPGDNIVTLRSRRNVLPGARLVFEEFVKWTGGLPSPFKDLEAGSLIQAEDDIGSYFYAEYRTGADTVCVYGMRRLTEALRELPARGTAMDILVRNCVRGTPEQALAPLLGPSVGFVSATRQSDGSSRMLSALAGPSVP